MDPAYRRSLVFIQMCQKFFRYEEEHGLVSIWGFTPSTQVFERLLGFQIPANTRQLFRPLRRSSVSQLLEQYLGRTVKASQGATGAGRTALRRGRDVRLIPDCWVAWLAPRGAGARAGDGARCSRPWGFLVRPLHAPVGWATVIRDQPYLRRRLFENPYVRSTVRAASWTANSSGGSHCPG